MAEQIDHVAALQAEAEEWVAVPSEVDSRSDAGDSHQDDGEPINQSPETQPDALEASSSRTETAPASVPFSDSGSESDGLPFVEAQSVVEKPEIAAPEDPAEDAMPGYAELPEPEWSQTECHMNDIRYAEKASATVPHRVSKKQLKVLVTGQPETGRTTTIKNLFASIAQTPDWSPPDVSGKTLEDFEQSPEAFSTSITDRPDTDGNLSITYVIQETPGLKAEPARCAEVLCGYLRAQHERFAEQERNLDLPRNALEDNRVDAVLYFLPTNARMAESDLDTTVINALAAFAPVIPVMCKADCLEEEEVQQRKAEMERLMANGLRVFTFPEDIVNAITDAMHGLSHSPASVSPTAAAPPQQAPPTGPAFRLPFNVVAGNHADVSVHNYWFVRVYRWAMCEAYRTCNSDLRLLRQLLLEDGFWAIKEAADALYRTGRGAARSAPATMSTGAQTAKDVEPAKDAGAADGAAEEIRHAGRGTHFVPTWPAATNEASTSSKATGASVAAMFPFTPVAGIRAATTTRGLGSPLRAACAGPTLNTTLSSSPPSPHVNPLLMASDATDGCSGPIAAGTSALAALEAAHPPPPAPAPAAPAPPPAPAPAPPAAPPAPPVAAPGTGTAESQDAYDARMYVDATVQGVTRGAERRNYRLTLRLEEGEKVLSMRIGDTEGASLASLLRQSRTSRVVAQMESELAVMRALNVTQGVAAALLEVHKGNAAAAIGAAVDGSHG